jgi:hypothetical protein
MTRLHNILTMAAVGMTTISLGASCAVISRDSQTCKVYDSYSQTLKESTPIVSDIDELDLGIRRYGEIYGSITGTNPKRLGDSMVEAQDYVKKSKLFDKQQAEDLDSKVYSVLSMYNETPTNYQKAKDRLNEVKATLVDKRDEVISSNNLGEQFAYRSRLKEGCDSKYSLAPENQTLLALLACTLVIDMALYSTNH